MNIRECLISLVAYCIVSMCDSSHLCAADDVVFYGSSELLTPIHEYAALPESGLMEGFQGYRVGQHSIGVSSIVLGKKTVISMPESETYRPEVEQESLTAKFGVSGRRIGSFVFGVNGYYHLNDLIFVGNGYRHITKMIPPAGTNRGGVIISSSSTYPKGVPRPEGFLIIPHGVLSTWDGAGFLREVRPTDDNSDQFEAVLDLWDRMVIPIGIRPPDRQLVLTKGDEFQVRVEFHGSGTVRTPTGVGPPISATGVGRIRCAGVYAPIPEKKFRGGVDLVPISLTITPVKN